MNLDGKLRRSFAHLQYIYKGWWLYAPTFQKWLLKVGGGGAFSVETYPLLYEVFKLINYSKRHFLYDQNKVKQC